ncbi:glycoside hydrolase family 127 protein [Babesia caballi]|uniref:Glycoside hydrolase family 127 protein n=1 Tax=Babesia caballi TaxID=5871 RepID=A0AAV4LZL4_BABCB|nr:glycoside hydrolase family 127 protein [Babesia caballi]
MAPRATQSSKDCGGSMRFMSTHTDRKEPRKRCDLCAASSLTHLCGFLAESRFGFGGGQLESLDDVEVGGMKGHLQEVLEVRQLVDVFQRLRHERDVDRGGRGAGVLRHFVGSG